MSESRSSQLHGLVEFGKSCRRKVFSHVLTEWVHWLSSLHTDDLVFVVGPLLLIDGPRYVLSKLLMCAWDLSCDLYGWLVDEPRQTAYTHCPSVCVIIPACNEGKLIDRTLQSVWGTYPRLEIIVVDEASDDDTVQIAQAFERTHPGVLLLTKTQRGGKSSAFNFGRRCTNAEVLIVVDGDGVVAPQGIWEIVQPFKDPRVGVVSGMITALNAFNNLVTRLQALEYLNSVLVGRILMARLDVLGIASGAFSAYRAECFDHGKGKDVGPTEDLDLSLRIRKSGYRIAFEPRAVCYTEVPDTWRILFKQRRFWEQGSVVKLYIRKHHDMAFFWRPNFRWSNLLHFADMVFFNFICVYVIWFYFAWLFLTHPLDVVCKTLWTQYVCYACLELVQAMTIFCYSQDWKRDLMACLVVPLSPAYQIFLRFVSLVAITEELFWRKSFADGHVPRHVRDATWHW